MKNDDQKNSKEEERQDSFLNLLFGVDVGAMAFFMVVRGDKLGEAAFPFQLAFYPFKRQMLILALCALGILFLRGANLFWHHKPCFRKSRKLAALVYLLVTAAAIIWGGCVLHEHPEFLPDSGK